MDANRTGLYRLLAVDDDTDCCELIVRNALKCGYEAFSVSEAEALEKAILHFKPHVITLDLTMPNVDGLEIVWRVRRVHFSGLVILVSGQSEAYRMRATALATSNGLKVPAQMPKPLQLRQFRDLLSVISAGLLPEMSDTRASRAEAPNPGRSGDIDW